MAIILEGKGGGKVLEVSLTGKLAEEDFEAFVPAVERLVRKHGKIRMLVATHDFEGWSTSASWKGTKFAGHHFGGIERLALIEETQSRHSLAVFCVLFAAATVSCFVPGAMSEALAWLEG